MTKLVKEVRRLVEHNGTRYVVSLVPARGEEPPRIEVRESRRRTPYGVPVGNLYVKLVLAATAAPRRTRKVKRGLLSLGGAR